MNPTQSIAARDRRLANETRRGTVKGDATTIPYNTAGLRYRVRVVDVDIGQDELIRNVIVQSQTGTGGREYARSGKGVIIRRNLGGRWMCIGPSDRTITTGQLQVLNEITEVTAAAVPNSGFTNTRVDFQYFATNNRWNNGTTPFNFVRVEDALGNEVL